MHLSHNVVLVTGGASGIGLAIAERFLQAGSEVVLCGRRAEKLAEAKAAHPGFHTHVCDLARADERELLAAWAVREFPRLNVLVNNAGIQRRVRLADAEPWDATREEIAINFDAPVHLSRLFIPHLATQSQPAIINITSGLSFSPIAAVPVYCATKAALHSFTLSLRHQLKQTPIRVVEIIPPAVNTDLGGPGLHTFGANLNEFADAAMAQVAAGLPEAVFGFSEQASRASRQELDEIFQRMNAAPAPR
jgi:uncharacterized oxidoreductase